MYELALCWPPLPSTIPFMQKKKGQMHNVRDIVAVIVAVSASQRNLS
jgi:hypothetical protein